MRCAAIAEIAISLRIRIFAASMDATDAATGKLAGDKTFQIELVVQCPDAAAKEALAFRVVLLEAQPKAVVNLIGTLRNAGADSCNNVVARCAERLHNADSICKYACQCAFPARMSSADNSSIQISEQDRRAIRRENSQGKPGLFVAMPSACGRTASAVVMLTACAL
jgi:hypothetical protein